MRDSVFLRPVMGRCIGTTKFFRNEPFLKALVRILEKIPHPRVLYHGCSNGAEAYSLAIAWCETGDGKPIDIHATDIEPSFLDQGRLLTHERLTARARKMVTFLPPVSVIDFRSRQFYDATVCTNVLCYLEPQDQREAIARIADYTTYYMCVTGADPTAVRQATRDADFKPCLTSWLPIYYGWGERLSWRHRKVWKLPYLPFLLPNWRYAGTTFRRDVSDDLEEEPA
jgi:hypothetical protein